jgi:hypothetical protein
LRRPLTKVWRLFTHGAYCFSVVLIARTLEDRNMLDMMMRQHKSGEINLDLTEEQYAKLRKLC